MSTLQQPPAPPRKKPGVEYVEYDKYIDRQVERTRKAVKLIDLAQALLVLVIGVVGFLLTAAVIEHWIFTGGLGTIGRFALFVVMAGSLGYYAVRYVWPLITSSINPAYAAAAIEREHPALKNSLLNFLLFRSHKKEMPAAVYEALEQQAAQRLSQTSIEDSIDRSALVKLGYVLLAVVVFATLHAMLSPKSSFTTAARVLMPWANIAAPSRVRIDDIKPGDVEIVEGDKVEITAQVTGLSEGELVEVSYDTIDGHRVDQRVAMQPANNAGKFVVTLPPPGDLSGLSGIDQDLRYRITAGDGRTIDYNIHVLTAPSIRVEKVHFDFPDYTGYADVTIDGRGDIRALEGTKVTIAATANTDIEAAFLDLASDGRNDARMKHEGSKAQVDVDLRLDDRRAIKTTSYMLRYTSTEGLANNQPPQHSLEIVPDYAPEVSVLAPEERAKDVQMNEMVPITVDALDPDFALRTVTLKFAKEDGTAVHDELLVDRAHKGRYQKDWNFTPVELKLQPGDIVEYWAEATDIRTPQANRTASDRKQFRVVGDPKQGQGQRGEGAGQPQEQGGENGEQGQAGENGQQGEKGQQGEAGQQGENGAQGEQGEQGENGQEGAEQGQQGGEQGQGNQQGENSQNGEGQGNQQGAGAAGEQQQGGEGMNEGQQQGAGGAAGEQQSESQGESQDGAGGEQGQNGANGSQQNAGEQGSQQGENGEGGEQQSGEGNQGGEQNSRPVANDGSDDASAFEKIQRQLSQEEQQNATRQQKEGTADPNGKMEQGDPQDAQQGERGQQGEAQGKKSPEGSGSEGNPKPSQGDPQGQGEKANSNEAGNKQAGEQGQKGEGQKPDGQEGSAAEREAEGAGADAKTDAPQSEGGKPSESQPDAGSKSAGSEERNAGGEPGAGQDTKAEGTPEAQEEMRERDKKPDMGEGGEEQGGEPPTPAHGKHQSDSASSQGGDRPGGGDEGGGQKAPRKGTGSAGQNEAADEGAGQSDDQGPGEAGSRGGDSQKADGKTGQSGDEKGNGSESRQGQGEQQGQGQPQGQQQGNQQQQGGQQQGEQQQGMQQGEKGEQGQQQGDQQGQQQGNEAEGEQASKGEPGQQGQPGKNEQQQNQPQNKQETSENSNSPASQGGQPGGNDGTAPGQPQGAFDGKLAEGDKANLDYTRQQTNMVLEKLADQLDKNEVDQKMLDELGWSEEDLRQFVDRWNKLRAAAEKPNATDAKQELDARLRSLGGSIGIKGGTTKRTEDDFRNLTEGYQNKVPLKYRDRLKAYTEGVSRGAEE